MDESHSILKNLMLIFNTPEFSPKQIIILCLKFKLLLVLSIIPGLLFFILTSNELFNSQCYDTLLHRGVLVLVELTGGRERFEGVAFAKRQTTIHRGVLVLVELTGGRERFEGVAFAKRQTTMKKRRTPLLNNACGSATERTDLQTTESRRKCGLNHRYKNGR